MIQMKEPLETAELLAFVRVVEARSFSRAAAELAIPRATLGRRLARLEGRLHTRLLRRTTRSLSLTDAGQTFYRQAKLVLEAVGRAEASVKHEDDVMRGELRVSIAPMPSEQDLTFSKLVTSFAKEHPEVRLQVDVSTRLVDLLREGYDVALRATGEIAPGLVARQISRHRVIAVASPEYLAVRGTPRTAKDLRAHRCLTGFARGELPMSSWPVRGGTMHVESAFASNELRMLRDAALEGLGIALLPQLIVRDFVARGALVQVLEGVVETENRLAVVYAEREFMPPHVRLFVDALVEWASSLERMLGGAGKRARQGTSHAAQATPRSPRPSRGGSNRTMRSRGVA